MHSVEMQKSVSVQVDSDFALLLPSGVYEIKKMEPRSKLRKVILFCLLLSLFGMVAFGYFCPDQVCALSARERVSESLALTYAEAPGRPLPDLIAQPGLSYDEVLHDDFRFDLNAHDVMVFLHIQKTGGTSFGKHLVMDLDLKRPCNCQRARKRCHCFRPHSNEIWLFSRYSTGWKCGLHADFTELTACVGGELDRHEGSAVHRRYFYITLLREPVARYLSEYKHVKRGATWKGSRHWCQGRTATGAEVPACYTGESWRGVTLEEFTSCPWNLANNRQTRMLADLALVGCYNGTLKHRSAETDRVLLASAKRNLAAMAYFGLTEFQKISQYVFEETFNLLFAVPFSQHNVTVSGSTLASLTPAQVALIKRLNSLDLELYDFAKNLMFKRMKSQFTKRDFFYVWLANAKETRADALLHYILKELGDPSLSDEIVQKLKTKIRSFKQKIEEKWAKSTRHQDRFLTSNSLWLEEYISFSEFAENRNEDIAVPRPSTHVGRPQTDFETASTKTKRRRIQSLLEMASQGEMAKATEVNLRQKGNRDSAAIVKELCLSSPKRGTAIKKMRLNSNMNQDSLSADKAVALIIDANLSTHQYNIISEQTKNINKKIYPTYHKVKEAKQMCYPSDINISETRAEINIQSLMDHTIKRLCKAQEEVLKNLNDFQNIEIIVKWGCDGPEQTRYKQFFSEKKSSDESLFSISMVPIQMNVMEKNVKKIVWQNPSPSSTRYCRPMKVIFAKETVDLINKEINTIKSEIESLTPTNIFVNDNEVMVKPILLFCMIDGKICNAVASCASTQTCYICGAKPKEMNNTSGLAGKPVNTDLLTLGLSPLHSWIRFFECLLHISYRLDLKTWQARGIENKNIVAEKKKSVQEKFRRELGLLVDMPKAHTGNTNDGNTARIFFRNAEISAEITGIKIDLIRRFRVILECINSGIPINTAKFDEYAKATCAFIYSGVSLVPYASVHKILFHGKDIIPSCILPIGQLSEEAQEARNKHNKKFRELVTRKTSRVDTNRYLINRLLISSDPYIASLRAPPKTKRSKINLEMCELLEIKIPITRNESISEESDLRSNFESQDDDTDCGSDE